MVFPRQTRANFLTATPASFRTTRRGRPLRPPRLPLRSVGERRVGVRVFVAKPLGPGLAVVRPFLHLDAPGRRLLVKKSTNPFLRREAARNDLLGVIDDVLEGHRDGLV